MNDLDRKIAELKGWKHIGSHDVQNGVAAIQRWFPKDKVEFYRDRPDGGTDFGTFRGDEPTWSTSIEKAFELVDELSYEQNNRLRHYGVAITKRESELEWACTFVKMDDWISTSNHTRIMRKGKTASEAICRAYIAVREAEKGVKA